MLQGLLHLHQVQHLVFDEVDTLITQGFKEDMDRILFACRYKYKRSSEDPTVLVRRPRILMATATWVRNLNDHIPMLTGMRGLSSSPSVSEALQLQALHPESVSFPCSWKTALMQPPSFAPPTQSRPVFYGRNESPKTPTASKEPNPAVVLNVLQVHRVAVHFSP